MSKAAELTRELAYAAGLDAGNRSMVKAGRMRWNEDDYDAASEVTNRLLDVLVRNGIAPHAL